MVDYSREPLQHHTPKRKSFALGLIAFVTFSALTAAFLLRFLIGDSLTVGPGEVALRDIRAPRRAQYVSELETARQRDLAEAGVAPVFTPLDAQIARQQVSLARTALDQISAIRQTEGSVDERVRGMTEIKTVAINEATARGVIAYADAEWARIDTQVINVLDSVMRGPIRPDNIEQVRRSLRQQISLSLNTQQAAMVETLAAALLVPNTNYDESATIDARQAARDGVKPVERVFEANQIIIRSGQIVGPADIEAMEALNLRRPQITLVDVFTAMIMSALSVFVFGLSILRRPDSARMVTLRTVGLSAATLTVCIFIARWLLPGHGLLPYLAPIAAAGIAISSWSGTLAGVLASTLAGVTIGIALDSPLEFSVLYGMGGVVASVTLGRATRMSDFIRAGLLAGAIQVLVVLMFNLAMAQRPGELPQLVGYLVAGLSGGLLSSGLALAAVYISGLIFDITTVVQLNDLARPSHPLIQRMLLTAPGTYHHSLMVGNLAEQAAERIGADSLLARVGAYYHDIGKLENPHHFIENQLEGVNIHDRLEPRASASLLHAHVSNGLTLAKKYRLPARIRDFIAQHHGTMRTNYQYQRAVKAANGAQVEETPYRYPGPRPQSRETAIMMLADACEATVRACKCETIEEMDRVIRHAITERLADHQLDDCTLTLRDIDQIRRSFLDTLRGIYHPRVEYQTAANTPMTLASPALASDTIDQQKVTASA